MVTWALAVALSIAIFVLCLGLLIMQQLIYARLLRRAYAEIKRLSEELRKRGGSDA